MKLFISNSPLPLGIVTNLNKYLDSIKKKMLSLFRFKLRIRSLGGLDMRRKHREDKIMSY